MTLTASDILIAIILISCVPIQYLIVQNLGSSESYRAYTLHKVVNKLSKFYDDYLSVEFWKKCFISHVLNIKIVDNGDELDTGESPAIEVMQHRHKHNYFSFSPDPRINRPPTVQFRVGQVVMHKHRKYRAVVVGWDEIAKAPPEWLDEMYGKEKQHWRTMPNYSLLVDTRDRLTPQLTYVPQENLIPLKDKHIVHPLIDVHFESFDGSQYIPRPWLKAIYPQD